MSSLAIRSRTSYSFSMSHWTPLQYVASLGVFALVVAFAATLHLSAATRGMLVRQGHFILALALHILMFLAGRTLGLLAVLGRPATWMLAALGELWSPPVAHRAGRWFSVLTDYCEKGQFYRPEHAA
jgi:hypothetical protein